jgi:outer membrane receptor protein involved in Fe transport
LRRWIPLLCVAAMLPAAAQTIYTGELTGNVTDPSGKTIAGANVDLTRGATGEKSSIATSSTGEFRFPLLRPGVYTVAVSAAGFETKTQQTAVELGQSSNLEIQLGIQGKKENLLVTAQAPLLQSNNANLATTFDQNEVENSPNPGNDLTVFAFTAPGVTMSTAGGSGNFSVFGLPAISNLFTLNGMDITDPHSNLNVSGATNLTLGANQIQEVAVVLNGYTGQYGRLAGANVNYITKSGANTFHGNASWSYNGRDLNANNWFDNATGTARPFSISNAWADSLGGPVLKNKLFFFFDNEGLRYVLPGGGPVYIPTSDFANFVLTKLAATTPAAVPLYTTAFNLYAGSSGAARATPVTAAIDPQLGCGDLVDPVFGVSKPCAATFQDTVNALNDEWLAAARVDYDITSSDRIYLRLSMDHGLQVATDPINPAFSADSSQPMYSGQLSYTKIISSNSVNSLLLSASYYSFVFGPPDLGGALRTFPTTFAFNNGLFTNLGGSDDTYPSGNKERQWQLVDDYSYLHGRHTFKVGVNVRKNFVSSYFYGAFTSGLLTFNSMTDFVDASLTNGSNYSQAFATIGAENVTFASVGLYGQDEWRVRPNLMITLALRLDRNGNIGCNGCFTELADQGSFDQIAHSASIPYNQTIRTGLNTAFHDVDLITPEPRLGVAYNVTKSTVLRGGIGLFADSNPELQADRFLTNAPTESIFTTTSGLVATGTPNGVFAIVSASNAALQEGFANGDTLAQLRAHVPLGFTPPQFFTISQNVHSPKYSEWNAEVQHAFGDKYLLSVNYVGNHGFDEVVQQLFGNAYSPAGLAGLPTTALDPRFGEIVAMNTEGWSNYDGLVTSFRWRMNAQFAGQFSYTWSHALDTCSNDCLTELFGSTGDERFQLNPLSLQSLNYGNADYDVRHSLSAHYVYTAPTAHLHNAILKAALGGWTAAGTVFFHSGYPFSIVDTGVLSQFRNLSGKPKQAILADFLGGGFYPSCTTPNVACYLASQFATATAQHDFGNIPRNSFRGPGYFDTDLNLNKTFAVAEKYRLLIGASFFDILNHPNFGPPVNNVSSGSFGQIQTTASEPTSPYGGNAGPGGRVIQTLVKFSF